MHAKVVKSISLEDNGDIKKGDTVWMIAIQAKRNGHCCKYVSDAVFTSRKEASEAVVKVYQEIANGNVKVTIATLTSPLEDRGRQVIKVAILDGVLYIKGRRKMYREITETYKDYNIMSVLVLRDFLYQI